MTAKELACRLDGREYLREITAEECAAAKEAGLVVVFGCSDDLVEFRGAVDDEIGAYDGTSVYITGYGILQDPDCDSAEDCVCPYFAKAKASAREIRAVWHDKTGLCWTFETDIPHESFTVMEDGEPHCRGIVFALDALRS